jgi:PAS domain S-box-containing protein
VVPEALQFVEHMAGVGHWEFDLQTREMCWSPGMLSLLGLAPSAHTPSYSLFTSLIHPADRQVVHEMSRLIQDGARCDREFRVIRPDGRLRWVLSRCETLVGSNGRPERAVGIVQDITSRHEALRRGRWAEERFKLLLTATNAAIWTLRPDGEIDELCIGMNHEGRPVAHAADAWKDAVHPDEVPATLSGWRDAVAAPQSHAFEHRLRGAGGEYRWYRSRLAIPSDRDAAGELTGLSVDIHDQKTLPVSAREDAATLVSGAQIRAARGILEWSVRELSEASGASSATIRRLESLDGLWAAGHPMLRPIRDALVEAGIEFLVFPSGPPGVRARELVKAQTLRSRRDRDPETPAGRLRRADTGR